MTGTIKYTHPLLGELTGVKILGGRVTQFRGVPFASVPGRFRQSVVRDGFDDKTGRDFSGWGPASPQHYDGPFIDGVAFGGKLPPEEHEFDEFKCLNLTISVPTSLLESGDEAKVPVLAWVHGGGLKTGGGACCGLEDCARIVDLSIAEGKPVVAVAIQYRLDIFGFLSSTQLQAYSASHNENPFNYGLWDAVHAFEWIHSFIPGFSGDDKNITAFGESAGASVVSYLMIAKQLPAGLFKRAILQSGIATTIPVNTHDVEQDTYDKLCAFVSSDGSEIDVLLNAEVDKLMEFKSPPFRLQPVVDGVMFTDALRAGDTCRMMYECEWVDEILAGNTGDEGGLFGGFFDRVAATCTPAEAATKLISIFYGPSAATKTSSVLEAFGLSAIATSSDLLTVRSEISALIGALLFDSQAYFLVNYDKYAIKKRDIPTYYYRFAKKNPFPEPPFEQNSHHFVDLLYLFQNVNDRIASLPSVAASASEREFEKKSAVNFAKKWIEFANGEEPWEVGKIGILGDKKGMGEWEVVEEEEFKKRDKVAVEKWDALIRSCL
ncbi:Alpha/Beta hydrolase protein [Myxozyma melibiosi]|uniref:Alpha/Beta hydrolase protein n=1 Tax=Myxozyma melibiosi TaxID=54550 RepID=A0ABR1EZM6_9ASCO